MNGPVLVFSRQPRRSRWSPETLAMAELFESKPDGVRRKMLFMMGGPDWRDRR
jgi:hypothetical protein